MIEIKLTCETVAEAQAEMKALLNGSPTSLATTAPAPVITTNSTSLAVVAPAKVLATTAASDGAPASSTQNTEKRGRGRPRKNTVSGSEPATTTTKEDDEGNSPSGGTSATVEVEQPSVDASSTSSETATAADDPISDQDLQRFCARVAQHFGGPARLFDMCQPYVPEGRVLRPTNIADQAKRRAFVADLEAASGLKFHG
jgi:hypothetical protein